MILFKGNCFYGLLNGTLKKKLKTSKMAKRQLTNLLVRNIALSLMSMFVFRCSLWTTLMPSRVSTALIRHS